MSWLDRLKKADAARASCDPAANEPAPEPPLNPADWRELAQAYHAHHFKCKDCIAAGRGAVYGLRCGIGAALWSAYQEAPVPPLRW